MKIAIVSDVFYPYLLGGAERRYWEIAKRLAKNHEVHAYTMQWFNAPKEEIVENINIHRFNVPKKFYTEKRRSITDSIIFATSLLHRFLREEKFDIIDANQFPFFPIFSSKWLSLKSNCPLVVTWHEVWNDYWYEYLENRLFGFMGKQIEKISSKLPDKIISVSNQTKKQLINKLKVPEEKIVVIGSGIDTKFIDSIKAEKQENKILFVGRLLPHKNVDLLINAMPHVLKEFPDANLTIIGEGPVKNGLVQLTKKLGIENHVKILGNLDYKGVIKHMKSSSLFVLPSKREGFGIVLVESMASKTPVIGIKAEGSGVLDVLNGKNGILCGLSELKENIIKVLKNQNLREELVREGYAYSRKMDWDIIIEKILNVYQII